MLKTTCRLCGSTDLAAVATLPDLPLVDRYSREPNTEPLYPCGLQMCRACGHIQLAQVIAPDLLFGGEYLFRTGDYPWLVAHYNIYAAQAMAEFGPKFVVEIGSNDGTLLKMFEEMGCKVLGVDPSNVPSCSPVRCGRFGTASALVIGADLGLADLIVANHVFAHNDDLSDIVNGVKTLLAPEGVFIFETNSGLDLLERNLFDIVYHEHMDYHTVKPLTLFFARLGLQLFRVEHNESKGGTIKGYVCHMGAREPEPSVSLVCAMESAARADRPEIFTAFNERLGRRRASVWAKLEGKDFIGYGAAAGGIATLYHLGLEKRCAWLVDDSPRRHGMLAPHSNLIVKPTSTLYSYETHHGFQKIVSLSWRYAKQIQEKHPNLEIIVP